MVSHRDGLPVCYCPVSFAALSCPILCWNRAVASLKCTAMRPNRDGDVSYHVNGLGELEAGRDSFASALPVVSDDRFIQMLIGSIQYFPMGPQTHTFQRFVSSGRSPYRLIWALLALRSPDNFLFWSLSLMCVCVLHHAKEDVPNVPNRFPFHLSHPTPKNEMLLSINFAISLTRTDAFSPSPPPLFCFVNHAS